MKKKIPTKPKPQKKLPTPKVAPVVAKPAAPPDAVYLTIRKLLDTTNHIQARAAELENALDDLRDQEQGKAVAKLLTALRHSQDGDLLRFNPAASGEGEPAQGRAIVAALVEAFGISPLHTPGERLPVRRGEIPDSLELDRAIGDEDGRCIAAEVVSTGWKRKDQVLLKPVVRPVFNKSS